MFPVYSCETGVSLVSVEGLCKRALISRRADRSETKPMRTRKVARANGRNRESAAMASAEPYSLKNRAKARVVEPNPAKAIGRSAMATTRGENTMNRKKGILTSKAIDRK